MPPGGWCSMPTSGTGGARRTSSGPRNAAAMLSRTSTSGLWLAATASTRGASRIASGNGRSGNDTNSSRAAWAGASSARRRWNRYPPVSLPGSPSVIRTADRVRVIHVAPTPFGLAGLFGGGERYPLELARALARQVDCELITFGREARAGRVIGECRTGPHPSYAQSAESHGCARGARAADACGGHGPWTTWRLVGW